MVDFVYATLNGSLGKQVVSPELDLLYILVWLSLPVSNDEREWICNLNYHKIFQSWSRKRNTKSLNVLSIRFLQKRFSRIVSLLLVSLHLQHTKYFYKGFFSNIR